jgi:L-fucose isomerase-like protein
MDTEVCVKPVYVNLVHGSAYEGPCRVGERESLTPEADVEKGARGVEEFAAGLRENLPEGARLLEPALLSWSDSFVLPEEELRRLEPDVHQADLVLVAGGLHQYPAVRIAEEYRRPVGQIGWVTSVDIAANLRARGMEGYAFLDHAHLAEFVRLLGVRKAFRRMNVLVGSEGDTLPSVGVVSGITDLRGLRERYGVRHVTLTAARFLGEMDGLPPEAEEEVSRLTDTLIANARACHMSREDLEPSVRFFVATKRLLERHEANAFVIPCFEICATRVMEQRRVMFCLAHSLLKSLGVPSACEADFNVLMGIALLTFLARKGVHMGNTSAVKGEENVLAVHHDVPGLRMHGLDGPEDPYELRNFTVGGWGATVRYDFARDAGTPVTLARFDPTGRRVLVAEGELIGGGGFDRIGCSLEARVRLTDIRDFFEKQQDFGHHMAMVYGSYAEDVRRLGRIMGFETVTA